MDWVEECEECLLRYDEVDDLDLREHDLVNRNLLKYFLAYGIDDEVVDTIRRNLKYIRRELLCAETRAAARYLDENGGGHYVGR